MDVIVERCVGSDVHKKTVVVCRLTLGADGQRLGEKPSDTSGDPSEREL